MKAIHKIRLCSAFCISLALFSCSEERVFEEFKAIGNESWQEQDTISFRLDLSGNEPGSQLIGVRFNEDYQFSNLYIRYISKDSTGKIIDNKLLNVPLFDSKQGVPLGKGFGDTFTKFDTLPFPLPKNASELSLIQYMRIEEIKGIEAVGVKILKK